MPNAPGVFERADTFLLVILDERSKGGAGPLHLTHAIASE